MNFVRLCGLAPVLLSVSCSLGLSSAESGAALKSFSLAAPSVQGVIDDEAGTVALTVPDGTDRSALTPTLVYTGIRVSPRSGETENFTAPVTYTVTSAFGSSRDYRVKVSLAGMTAKAMTAFSFASPAAEGVINEAAGTVAVTLPSGTSPTALTPTIVHTGASVSPASGVARDFTTPVTYLVTAADGSTKAYRVTVTIASADAVPPDSGGTQTAYPKGTTAAGYGYWAYLPGGYATSAASYPLLVFLHGSGEVGDGSLTGLAKVKTLGPPLLISTNKWTPTHPMIVVSPQDPSNANTEWVIADLKAFLNYLYATYRVDRSRVYLTGVSMGGWGIYDLLIQDGSSSGIAAAVPISGRASVIANAKGITVPIWAFHGSEVTGEQPLADDVATIAAINSGSPPVRAKLTAYADPAHDAWTRTYDGTGRGTEMAAYDPYPVTGTIWDWMYQYTR